MAEKKKAGDKPAASGKTSTSKRGGKAIESKTGAGAALAARSKDTKATGAKAAAKPSRAKKTSAASAKPATKPAQSKSTEKPSIAKRVLRTVKSAAGGVASLAGSVVGRN